MKFFSEPDQGNILKNSAQPKTLETNPSPPLTCAIGLTPHSLIAAAKIEQFIPHLQIFYQLFSKKMNISHKSLTINTYKIRSRNSNSTSSFTFKPQIHHRTNRNSSYYPKWNVFKFPQMQSKSQDHINSTYNQWFTYSTLS